MKVTALANSNIAILKYWGKRDYQLNLPTNSSISFTMDDQLQTITTVETNESLTRDELYINDQPASEKETERAIAFMDIIRKMAKTTTRASIYSKNSFPKSAGMASSASGFAALAGAGSKAYGLELNNKEISILARQGSGSAARSVFGGAVEWKAGTEQNGLDSYAVQLSSSEKWKHLRNVIAISSEGEKRVSSVEGMKRIPSSELFPSRLKGMKNRLKNVREAINEGNFEKMAVSIMRDSNNMHAIMLESWPPALYLSGTSFEIIQKIHDLNDSHGKQIAAYTFDAGPNAHIYTTEKFVKEVEKILTETEGVKRTIICGIGEGLRFVDNHLK
ncbi:MAG: diphosphomevalonate decarboxylase [Candidatus Micrarchaeota archaeon]